MRQTILARTFGVTYPKGYELAEHAHDWDQLVYAVEGVMRVQAAGRSWFVPPHRALWMPARIPHRLVTLGRLSLRTLYLRPGVAGHPSGQSHVFGVPPLLRELILHAVAVGPLSGQAPEHQRLLAVLLDQLRAQPPECLSLPWPRDPRAADVARRIEARLRFDDPVADLIRGSGASRRTIERCFAAETGLTLGRWRRQLRLLRSLESLTRGRPVTDVSFEVGYESPSAFIAAFRATFGTTPGRYLADRSRGITATSNA